MTTINTNTNINIFCPLDDRYSEILKELNNAGEVNFMKLRLEVEIKYFLEMVKIKNRPLTQEVITELNNLLTVDPTTYINDIKEIEKTTKHDVKAVEYFLRQILEKNKVPNKTIEMVHYGLTSQDINTPALSLQLKSFNDVLCKNYDKLIQIISTNVIEYNDLPMLAKTHGQPAIPTTLGNQFKVVLEALKYHINILKKLTIEGEGISTKFGGAVGHLNAHYYVDPEIDWHSKFDKHISDEYQLKRIKYVTQNLPYTYWSPIFDAYKNINCILSDFCQDIWLMISNGIFTQSVEEGQIGSSAMPQKVNPINFENAEGNADMAINMFEFLSRRLTKSRLQRDLTDSTILRNLPMPFGYSLIVIKSLIRGLNNIKPNHKKMFDELESNPSIISEGLQTILRNIGFPNPYEVLRKITQNTEKEKETETDKEKQDVSSLKDKLYINIQPIWHQGIIEMTEETISKIEELNTLNYLGMF